MTPLNLIAGLDRPTAGTVTVAGRRIDNLGESGLARFRARHVGIIFQFFNLLGDLTVEDNERLAAARPAGRGVPADRAGAGLAELLERMGIERHRNDYPARLSAGPAAAAGGDRAGAGERAGAAAGRRADRALNTATGLQIGRLLSQLNAGGQTLVLITHYPGAGRPVRGPHRSGCSTGGSRRRVAAW